MIEYERGGLKNKRFETLKNKYSIFLILHVLNFWNVICNKAEQLF